MDSRLSTTRREVYPPASDTACRAVGRGARGGRHRVRASREGRHAAAAGVVGDVRTAASPAKKVKRWRKAIRRVTKSLGQARDRDVQIECLCGTLSALNAKECFPGVAHVLVQLEHDRERLQRRVVKAVDRLEAAAFCGRCGGRPRRLSAGAGSTPERHPQTPEACHASSQHILRQLDELLQYEAAWPIRTTAGITTPCGLPPSGCGTRWRSRVRLSGAARRRRGNDQALQTLLGDIHDCDVWLDHLDAFASDERDRIIAMFGHAGRFLHLLPGIEYLRQGSAAAAGKQTFEELAEILGRIERAAISGRVGRRRRIGPRERELPEAGG